MNTIFSEKYLKDIKMQLLIDNQKYQTIKIEGDMLTDKRHPLDFRGVTTFDSVDLTSDFIKNHECRLVEIKN